MKIVEDYDLFKLTEHGFLFVDQQYHDLDLTNGISGDEWGDFIDAFDNQLVKEVGGARRGQDYFLLVDVETRQIGMYTTLPDGSTGAGTLDDTLLKLFKLGLVE